MKNKISINCHSSIKINGNKVIYFDPYKIENESHDADIIFITHEHYDHFDFPSILKVMKEDTIIVIPDRMAPQVLGKISARNVVGVHPNNEYLIDDICVETIPSYNTNKEYHLKSNEWVGYVVVLDDERIYVAGDTDITEESLGILCDIALIPIGGTYTMNYQEGAELINKIKPKVVIPTHYGDIVGDRCDGMKFKALLDDNIDCLLLIK